LHRKIQLCGKLKRIFLRNLLIESRQRLIEEKSSKIPSILSGLPSISVILCVLPRKGGSAYDTDKTSE
jgi:hypothetical protein